ncbi:MAG TPA: DUF1566 domain-containing protein [Magnetococcales bacterium]|nr:DUF1566 domain-containing protein [Magnetococcales bacterium]
MKKTVLTFAALLALAGSAQAADLAVPHTFSPGTPIKSSDMNENFTNVYGKVNAHELIVNAIKTPGSQHVDNGNGTVTDRLTDLIWLKNANCFGQQTWDAANASAAALASGQCGLTDGSAAGAWRLPTIMELKKNQDNTWPVQTTNHPFSGVQTANYWSGSTYASDTSVAWYVSLGNGDVSNNVKTGGNYVWPVRGGQ